MEEASLFTSRERPTVRSTLLSINQRKTRDEIEGERN